MAHFYISAAHKSSGKTTVSIGLTAALTARGHRVQAFKKGPDYIDPIWLSQASGGLPCHNLDFNTQGHSEILDNFTRLNANADVSLIEGNKGLYDGMDLHGEDSNAAMAKLLKAPVILVLDTRGTIRGVAPLLLGYQQFDTELNIAGVILNQVGGSRHEGKLRAIIEEYTDIEVLGAVQRNASMNIDERHLGLMPGNEDKSAYDTIDTIGAQVASQVNLSRLMEIASMAPATEPERPSRPLTSQQSPTDVRIGIAQDPAFGFYYADDLESMRQHGVELVTIDTLHDRQLPTIDALFIGGGFPETQMTALEANSALRRQIYQAIEDGLPTYAECGGLMYLCRSIQWQGESREMVGIIPADAVMQSKPQGRGYIRVKPTSAFPWPEQEQVEISAHEFHYSHLEGLEGQFDYAYEVLRGVGIDGKHDGLIYKNLLACYAHMRHTRSHEWVTHFVDFVRRHKQQQDAVAATQ
ncbi:MAG: hydrogenobyrinic acid a,c-diamide synthase (glutamine-hydrolyzing) [Gammaproteobacteria bacterium]|nr:hydrogenobyrinic acid a,c-diamide synthase (glutamine-hydrolyzing) [Gammaproteobacteria bacterium]